MTALELVARWSVGGQEYFELFKTPVGYWYRFGKGGAVSFHAPNRDAAVQHCEKLLNLSSEKKERVI